jgi:sugar/nucleoside kinase (ribokinase family)
LQKIVTLGEILVEIMATRPGQTFREPGPLIGPFCSGAPAIFIDQVAKLGHPCGIIGSVGDDDFGSMNIERLRDDGVDVSAIEVRRDRVTGSAFVRYQANGERDFIFNIAHSAAGQVTLGAPAERLLAECRHLHVMGSSLFSPGIVAAAKSAIGLVKGKGGTVSFDPNVRKEMLALPEMRAALGFMLRHCDLFLPSGPELTLLTDAKTEDEATREILGTGVTAIVVKRGMEGAAYHDAQGTIHASAFRVEEVDPTGAGDCFGATFVTCRLQGRSVEAALRYANASGARAVGIKGPMEGTSTFAELEELIRTVEARA